MSREGFLLQAVCSETFLFPSVGLRVRSALPAQRSSLVQGGGSGHTIIIILLDTYSYNRVV
jgi:hypothetical protein